MKDMMIFQNPEFGEVRAQEINGEPWFVLKDVCRVLGITRASTAAERLDEDDVGQTDIVDDRGYKQKMYIINESGLYTTVIRSDKPQAKAFRKWITGEVLPSIRKTGSYQVNQSSVIELPHRWLGQGAILAEDAAKELGIKKEKIRDLLAGRPTVYVKGVDWDTLRGDTLSEYKFYNRVDSPGKALVVIYESGWKKLQWEVLGLGAPDAAMLPAREAPALPAAVVAKQEKMERGLEQIALVIQELIK